MTKKKRYIWVCFFYPQSSCSACYFTVQKQQPIYFSLSLSLARCKCISWHKINKKSRTQIWSQWRRSGFVPQTATSPCVHKNLLEKWPLKEDTSLTEQSMSGEKRQNQADVKPATRNKYTLPVSDAYSYSHLWLRRLPLYMVMTRRGKHRWSLCRSRAHFATALSLCPKIDRVPGVLPAPASQPSHSRPYHLSNCSRGSPRFKFCTLLRVLQEVKMFPFICLSVLID